MKKASGRIIMVNIIETESTAKGDMADMVVDCLFKPTVGMILMDEDSQTWEVAAALHDSKRLTEEKTMKRWTLQCKPVNADKPIHPGEFKLIH